MIKNSTYHRDWIYEVKHRLGKKYDPKLIEKVIYALILLEQLKIEGLEFIFKGGTALLLATEKPKRFSIDIDIITEQTQSEIEPILKTICTDTIFTHWEDDNNRKHTPDAPVGHFKLFYKSSVDGNIEPILLDVLYTANPYPELIEIPIAHDWIQIEGETTTVKMPTFDAILGDKLTAFAPKTTGILYSKGRPVEIIKQLFDVAFLMDNISDLSVVGNSYSKVVKEELSFRNLHLTAEEVLNDTQEACYILSTRDSSEEFKHLQTGISNFTNFTIDKFNIDEAIIAASKVTYLIELLKLSSDNKIEMYDNPIQLKEWQIEVPQFNKLNKLKKSNPEAFFYWFKAIQSIVERDFTPSNEEIGVLKEAIKYYRAREGSYTGSNPLLIILSKIDSKNKFEPYTREELNFVIRVLNENIAFMNKYEYSGLGENMALNNKQNILIPLYKMKTKISEILQNVYRFDN